MDSRFIIKVLKKYTVDPEIAFNLIQNIGRKKGWYAWNLLWQLRWFIDLLLGGVGMRRGRYHKDKLIVGGTIDLWRIE